jgi:hypothetical protein
VPSPWDSGLGGVVFLGDSASLGLVEAPAALGLEVFGAAEWFGVSTGLGEPLVPLRLGCLGCDSGSI